MVEENQRHNPSFHNAVRKLNKVEEYYAKMILQFSNKTRLKLYRKIASLMKNRFSLMDALDMLHDGASNGRQKSERTAGYCHRLLGALR